MTLHRRRVCIVLVLDICVALVLNICVAQAMAIEMCRISSNVPQEAEYCDTSLWLYLPIDSHHASIPAQGFATPMTLTKQLRVPVALGVPLPSFLLLVPPSAALCHWLQSKIQPRLTTHTLKATA